MKLMGRLHDTYGLHGLHELHGLQVSRALADDLLKRVVIVDTSNEIGGDGDIPHVGIGRARRIQVSGAYHLLQMKYIIWLHFVVCALTSYLLHLYTLTLRSTYISHTIVYNHLSITACIIYYCLYGYALSVFTSVRL